MTTLQRGILGVQVPPLVLPSVERPPSGARACSRWRTSTSASVYHVWWRWLARRRRRLPSPWVAPTGKVEVMELAALRGFVGRGVVDRGCCVLAVDEIEAPAVEASRARRRVAGEARRAGSRVEFGGLRSGYGRWI
jgi:hypothetical protein